MIEVIFPIAFICLVIYFVYGFLNPPKTDGKDRGQTSVSDSDKTTPDGEI